MEEIVNKVAQSGLITLDPAGFLPDPENCAAFDLKPLLFRELLLKEKDFRAALKALDWDVYRGKFVTIYCSSDAIIPLWAYMLVTTYLQPVARGVYAGPPAEMDRQLLLERIRSLDPETYRDKRIVIKGCGDRSVPAEAYVAIMQHLQPVVKSLMFGEPCSTVPVYKQKRLL